MIDLSTNGHTYVVCAGCGTEIIDIHGDQPHDKSDWRHVKGFGVREGCTTPRPAQP